MPLSDHAQGLLSQLVGPNLTHLYFHDVSPSDIGILSSAKRQTPFTQVSIIHCDIVQQESIGLAESLKETNTVALLVLCSHNPLYLDTRKEWIMWWEGRTGLLSQLTSQGVIGGQNSSLRRLVIDMEGFQSIYPNDDKHEEWVYGAMERAMAKLGLTCATNRVELIVKDAEEQLEFGRKVRAVWKKGGE